MKLCRSSFLERRHLVVFFAKTRPWRALWQPKRNTTKRIYGILIQSPQVDDATECSGCARQSFKQTSDSRSELGSKAVEAKIVDLDVASRSRSV